MHPNIWAACDLKLDPMKLKTISLSDKSNFGRKCTYVILSNSIKTFRRYQVPKFWASDLAVTSKLTAQHEKPNQLNLCYQLQVSQNRLHSVLRYSANNLHRRTRRFKYLGPVFPCTFDGWSNWSPINFGTWSEIISITVFPSPISDWSSIKSPIKLMAKYWLIKSDNWRLNVAICSSLLIRTRNIASLHWSERQFTH